MILSAKCKDKKNKKKVAEKQKEQMLAKDNKLHSFVTSSVQSKKKNKNLCTKFADANINLGIAEARSSSEL